MKSMTKRYEVIARYVCPGRPLRVICYTDEGHVWGVYKGYYNAKQHLFTLIPSQNENRYSLGVGKLQVHTISGDFVRRVDPT